MASLWKWFNKYTSSPERFNPLLCSKCQPWNDAGPLSSVAQSERSYVVDVSLHKPPDDPACLVCRAVFVAANARLERERKHGQFRGQNMIARNRGPVFLDDDFTSKKGCRVTPRSGLDETWMVLVVHIEILDEKGNEVRLSIGQRLCLRHTSTFPTRLLELFPDDLTFFNVDILKDWIRSCEDIHTDPPLAAVKDGTNSSLPKCFRVIDVESMNITRPDQAVRFVALSYMWHAATSEDDLVQLEKANLSALEYPGGLKSLSLPCIVSDAIALCRALEQRFLWVDRLCIVQDDTVSKQDQICAMDAVYNSATFTIMAALNNRDVDQGLPGCPELPGCPGRPRLPSIMGPPIIYDETTRSVQPTAVKDIIKQCLWNHRGWTFQERLLSRRRLFITEFQVIFQCGVGTFYEELADTPRLGPPQGTLIPEARGQHFRIPGFHRMYQRPSSRIRDDTVMTKSAHLEYSDYVVAVQDYTLRQLSFRTDVLNAFNGVGNVLGRGLATNMLFGLPENHLHLALQWEKSRRKPVQPSGTISAPVQKVPGWIPSWTWASAPYPVYYPPILDFCFSIVDFHYYDAVQSDQKHLPRKLSAKDTLSPSGQPSMPREFLVFVSHAPTVLARNACDVASRMAGSLIFNTSTTRCRLELAANDGPYHSLTTPVSGEPMGRIFDIDAAWIAEARSAPKEQMLVQLIIIAGGYDIRRGNKPDRIWLNVLLVSPHSHEPLAVRRIAAGRVESWELWQSCHPEWETVVLV